MTQAILQTPTSAWWRPEPAARAARAGLPAARATSSGVAFGALVAFTAILLLSPQAWFPLLGTLRIAFVVAATAIGAHLLTQIIRARDVPPMPAAIRASSQSERFLM